MGVMVIKFRVLLGKMTCERHDVLKEDQRNYASSYETVSGK
jgi:hypothetical protein